MAMDLESFVLGMASGVGAMCIVGGCVMAGLMVAAIVREVRADRRDRS